MRRVKHFINVATFKGFDFTKDNHNLNNSINSHGPRCPTFPLHWLYSIAGKVQPGKASFGKQSLLLQPA